MNRVGKESCFVSFFFFPLPSFQNKILETEKKVTRLRANFIPQTLLRQQWHGTSLFSEGWKNC